MSVLNSRSERGAIGVRSNIVGKQIRFAGGVSRKLRKLMVSYVVFVRALAKTHSKTLLGVCIRSRSVVVIIATTFHARRLTFGVLCSRFLTEILDPVHSTTPCVVEVGEVAVG